MAKKQSTRTNSSRTSSPRRDPEPKSEASDLSAAQERALQHLAAGSSISDAARKVGVDRKTIHRWLATDPHFAAAFNAWRREMVHSGRARVLAMGDLALDTVRKAIQKGDARVALQVARAAGAMDEPRPGATDPQILQRRRELRHGRRDLTLEAAEKQFQRDAERQRGEDKAWQKSVSDIDDLIGFLLEQREEALAAESPEDRARRLDEKRYIPEHERQVLRLLALAGAPPTPALPAPTPEPSAAEAAPDADAPDGGPVPAAPPAPADAAADPPSPIGGKSAVGAPADADTSRQRLATRFVAWSLANGSKPAANGAAEAPGLSRVEAPSARAERDGTPTPPPTRTRPLPVRAVRYDGSDDDEPGWEKIV